MNPIRLPSGHELTKLADELERVVVLHEDRGGTTFPVEWVSTHHTSPYPIYVAALRVAARASDRDGLAKAWQDAHQTNEDEIAALQRYLLKQTI